MAIANMANNNSKLSSAFKFQNIFHKLTNIGLKNLITFYLVILFPFYPVLYTIDILRLGISNLIIFILISLLIFPYLQMYLSRLIASFYMSEEK